MTLAVVIGYVAVGVALAIAIYAFGAKSGAAVDFEIFSGLVAIVGLFWPFVLLYIILSAVLHAAYWAVCKYITHDDFDNPFE